MKRHPTDVVSLAFGLLFLGAAAWWLVRPHRLLGHLGIPHFGWFAAGTLIVLGLLGITASVRGERSATASAHPPMQPLAECTDMEHTSTPSAKPED